MEQAQKNAKSKFLREITSSLGLAAAGASLSLFRDVQEFELRIARDITADPRCAGTMDICRRISVQTVWGYAQLWERRLDIVRLIERGMTPDAIVDHAIAYVQRKVAMYEMPSLYEAFRL